MPGAPTCAIWMQLGVLSVTPHPVRHRHVAHQPDPILALSTRPGGAGVGRPVWQAWTVQHARVAALAGRLLR